MKLNIGFSPCPNDTFIFDALIHHKIDTKGYSFDVHYEDVETLNQQAFKGQLDITKLSYHAFAHAVEHYALLDAGSALGFGVGPLLIAKNANMQELLKNYSVDELANLKVGIPGQFTTANFLLGLAFPALSNTKVMLFSDIESALLSREIDLGLIIHENRFTYQLKGLHKVMDLGDYWEKETGFPIPLGGIAVKRNLKDHIRRDINGLIRESVAYAFANPESGIDYIRSHAQEMDDAVLYQHIELYVNKYSEDLGEEGRNAVGHMIEQARALQLVPESSKDLFLD